MKQNPTTAHLDLQNQSQSQNQFSTGVNELGDTHRLSYNAHTLLGGGVYGQVQDTWGSLEPALSHMQCSQGRWSSMDFNPSSTEDFSNAQFFPDSYHDNSTAQSFCSPTTPGPSPHHPNTPTVSSPGPGPPMQPRTERLAFHPQASTQLSREQSLGCCLPQPDTYPPSSEHPHQTGRRPLPSPSEPIQDQTNMFSSGGGGGGGLESSFSPQGGGQTVVWREDCGGGDGQPDWTSHTWVSLKIHAT